MRIKRNEDIEGRRVLLNGEICGLTKIQGTVKYVHKGDKAPEFPIMVQLDSGRTISFSWEEIYIVMADVKSLLGKVIKMESRGKVIEALVVEIKTDPKAIRPIVVTPDFVNYAHTTIDEIEGFNEDPEALKRFEAIKESLEIRRFLTDIDEDPEED